MDVGDGYHDFYDDFPSDPTLWPAAGSVEDYVGNIDNGDGYHDYYDDYPSDPTPWPAAGSVQDYGITVEFFEGCEEDDIETVERCKVNGWDEVRSKLDDRRRNPPPEKEFRPPFIQHVSNVQRQWTEVVEAYSGCALTFPQDKFLAISGMAHTMAPEMGCAYLAGMWRRDLEHQLLWKVTTPQRAITDDRTRGPCWSWASRDGGVTFPQWWGGGLIEWFCEVDAVAVEPAEPSEGLVEPEYGQFQSGTLTLTGRLSVLRLPRDGTDRPGSRIGKLHEEERHIRAHWDLLETQEMYGLQTIVTAVWKYSTYGTPGDIPATAHVDPMDVFYMPFRIMDWDPDGRDYDGLMLTGLLLRPTGSRQGEYCRIGQFEMSEHWVEKSVRPLVDTTEILDEHLFVSRGREGRYIITVV